MIRKGLLKSFDSATYKATVQILGSLTTWVTIPTSHALQARDMVAGLYVAVLTPDPAQPGDSVLIDLWTAITPPVQYTPVTTANMAVYVDGDASGSATGVDWTNAFTTIQAAWDSLPDIVAHDVIIYCRDATNPYREEIAVGAKYVVGTVSIRGEFFISGACEAHAVGVGEIVDTGAFGDVAIGDHVYAYRYAANNRIDAYQICTVDDISNQPNRIGTDSAVNMNLTTWNYVIVRTHVSGSDDGTDGGTARTNCFKVVSLDNVTIEGFYLDFSDDDVMTFNNARKCEVNDCICNNCDDGISSASLSEIAVRRLYMNSTRYGLVAYTLGYMDARYCVVGTTHASYAAVLGGRAAGILLAYAHIYDGGLGLSSEDESWGYAYAVVIAVIPVGMNAILNSSIRRLNCTNNATVPEATASGGQIA